MKIALVRFKEPETPYTPEEVEAIQAAIIQGDALKGDGSVCWWNEVLVDLDALSFALARYEIVRWVWQPPASGPPGLDVDTARRDLPYNHKVNVVVPGFGLLAITAVKVCTDYCTVALQDELKDGWRILAICPQPDQRRPDYVLGRALKEDM